jgi:hypothetical protein
MCVRRAKVDKPSLVKCTGTPTQLMWPCRTSEYFRSSRHGKEEGALAPFSLSHYLFESPSGSPVQGDSNIPFRPSISALIRQSNDNL